MSPRLGVDRMIEVAAAALIVVANTTPIPPPPLEAEWYVEYLAHQQTPLPTQEPITLRPQLSRGMGGGDTEQWRTLVAQYFQPEQVDTMLCLMQHESGGNPNADNPNSSAAGLFQIMGFWWDKYGGNPYDPETNVALARVIYDQQGYGAWNPYGRGLCRQ